jgi:hypothetical protein
VKVTGVYEDFPDNSTFKEISFLAPWALYAAEHEWVKIPKTIGMTIPGRYIHNLRREQTLIAFRQRSKIFG